jgi:hypothetical protein
MLTFDLSVGAMAGAHIVDFRWAGTGARLI